MDIRFPRGGGYIDDFIELFGNHPQVRILQIIAENHFEELSVPYIVQLSKLPKSSVYKYIQKLKQVGLLKNTKIIRIRSRDTQLFILNKQNPQAHKLVSLYSLLLDGLFTNQIIRDGETPFIEEKKAIQRSCFSHERKPKSEIIENQWNKNKKPGIQVFGEPKPTEAGGVNWDNCDVQYL